MGYTIKERPYGPTQRVIYDVLESRIASGWKTNYTAYEISNFDELKELGILKATICDLVRKMAKKGYLKEEWEKEKKEER